MVNQEKWSAAAMGAYNRLKQGNQKYVSATRNAGDVSSELRERLVANGQHPYACVISCADSRVVPEHIFSAGLGELFCIRVAGNVVGVEELASCVYAVEHLGVQLVVVLGHTHCGAVGAALAGGVDASDPLYPLVDSIVQAIGSERDADAASVANARAGAEALLACPALASRVEAGNLAVVGALYRTDSGAVDFFDAR
ncbi:MAG: hypothetical protein IJ131_05985 [Eggerthellaceae bacterium]|nr:hypothetical protein [Eggerthellaceae bacterium]